MPPVSLKLLHTFALPVTAERIFYATTLDELLFAWQSSKEQATPFLLLGEGSNVLFLSDFLGNVVFNRLKGIEITEDKHYWHLHVAAGENWHQLVTFTLNQGMFGLENLALIPGCVGSAPIQNIGAYGVEFEKVCEYVDLLSLETGEIQRMNKEQCAFGYRESLFKHKYTIDHAIIAVGIRLAKRWQPILTYGELTQYDEKSVTSEQIFTDVCAMRRKKLPDPAITGNAGSFFKNPIITKAALAHLLKEWPDLPFYPHSDQSVKLAAGWLIDRCQLKGYAFGDAAVHSQQALVLVNRGNAKPTDVVNLARYVRQQVADKFSVWLEPEVRFIGSRGEVDALEELNE